MVISGLEEAEQEYDGLDVTFRMKPLLPDQLLATVHGWCKRALIRCCHQSISVFKGVR